MMLLLLLLADDADRGQERRSKGLEETRKRRLLELNMVSASRKGMKCLW